MFGAVWSDKSPATEMARQPEPIRIPFLPHQICTQARAPVDNYILAASWFSRHFLLSSVNPNQVLISWGTQVNELGSMWMVPARPWCIPRSAQVAESRSPDRTDHSWLRITLPVLPLIAPPLLSGISSLPPPPPPKVYRPLCSRRRRY